MINTVPAKPTTSPMSVRRSSAWARRPRVASNAIHNAAEALRMAVWLDATCCIAQLVQLFGMNTLPTATINRCRHSVASSSKRCPSETAVNASRMPAQRKRMPPNSNGGSACTPMLATR